MREDIYRPGMSTYIQDRSGYPRCNPGRVRNCNSTRIAVAYRNWRCARFSAPVVESMLLASVRSCSVDPGSRDVIHDV
jgi:hypothetical protein